MKENIKNYLNGVNISNFNKYNSDKLYLDLIDSWIDNETNYILYTDKQFQEVHEDLLFLLKDIAINSFEIFSAVFRVKEGNKQAINTFNNRNYSFISGVKEITLMADVINVNIQKRQLNEARVLQGLIITTLDKFNNLLLCLGIDLVETPLKKDFKKILKTINNIKIREEGENMNLNAQEININNNSLKKKTPLEAFVTAETNLNLVKEISEHFKDLKGKKMAALIYLLDNQSLISYDNGSKVESRKNFVEAFKGEEQKNIWAINKFFEPNTHESKLIDPNGKKDKTMKIIEEQLKKVVDSCPTTANNLKSMK